MPEMAFRNVLLPAPLLPMHGHHLAFAHIDIDAADSLDGAIANLKIADLEQQAPP